VPENMRGAMTTLGMIKTHNINSKARVTAYSNERTAATNKNLLAAANGFPS